MIKKNSLTLIRPNRRSGKGFTLIEVVIAITIIAVIGVITSTILTRSYRVGSSTVSISKLKQNGDLAVNQMADTLRTAEAVVCYGGTVSRKDQIVVRTILGKYIKFRFVDPVIVSGTVTVNGYIAKQENLNPVDQANFCSSGLVTPTAVDITNKDSESGVNVTDGAFTKLTQTVSKDTVSIEFNVYDTGKTSANGDAEVVGVQTSVQIR